jgi:hemoglobin
MKSLYDRIGGETAVRATVLKLYEKILTDDLLAPFFENTDVDALRRSQTAFVSYAFGAATPYTGRNLRTAHKKAVDQGLSDAHFNRVALHLQTALHELGVPQNLIDEALTIVGSTQADVLNK